jgi:hypothetical protein
MDRGLDSLPNLELGWIARVDAYDGTKQYLVSCSRIQ